MPITAVTPFIPGTVVTKLDDAALGKLHDLESSTNPDWWCPLATAPCRKTCVAYRPASFAPNADGKTYTVRAAYCTAYALVGPEESTP